MKFIYFSSLLESTPAQLAVLSTFQFDPDFFERRLLRCSALLKARRILIFMDASQWFKLLRQDAPARFMNRRYLVVPVRPKKGVFHPKLSLLFREDGVRTIALARMARLSFRASVSSRLTASSFLGRKRFTTSENNIGITAEPHHRKWFVHWSC